MKKVLVVDDEKLIVKGLKFSLEQDDMEVDTAYDGGEAIEKIKANDYDIVLLDIMIPVYTGIEVCQMVREFSNVPIIMLTAKGEDMDKIMGLEYGADDYITKPFNILEVKARIKAILRRSNRKQAPAKPSNVMEINGMKVELDSRRVFVGGKELNLTAKEFDLLELLMAHPNKVYSRNELLNTIWGDSYPGDARTVDVHVRRLREKIEANPGEPVYIHTKWDISSRADMKKKKRATVETEKIEEKNTAQERSRVSIRVGQRTIISLIVAVSVAVIAYAALWILAGTVNSKSERNLDRHAQECAEYIAHIVNEHKAEDDIGRAVDEIKTMAYSLSARIVIVDTDYKVVVDSYGKDTGRYLVDENVFSVMKGQQKYISETEENVYRRIVPVINSEGYTDAVALISLETDALDNLSIYMKRNATYLFAISLILGLIAAYFSAKLSVRDVNHVRNEIEGMKGGSLEPMSVDGMFRETQELTKDINDIFNKAQLLEESRQEFVSNVSHELKTPITSMKVLSESLLTQSDVPAEMYREFMEDIVQEIDREAEIISDLLTLVKTDKGPDSLNKEPVDMNEFMDLILKRLKPLAEKRSIQLSFESFGDIKAEIDKVKFTLAISNLIENGIKYNIDGGWIKVSLNSDHRNFYIKVADSGVGIPEDCINHIFERFYRVDKARSRDTGGTGLGLAITKNIIIMHKGTINVYSEPGKGTTFTVKIPLQAQE